MEGQETLMAPENFIPEIVKTRGWAGQKNLAEYNEQQKKNADALAFAISHWNVKQVDYTKPEEIAERLNMYFQACHEHGFKPTVSGLSQSLGVSRRTVWKWHNGVSRPENYHIIERAYSMLEELWEHYMMHGMINPASGIFLGKNHFDYKDVQDVIVQPKNPLGEEISAEEIEQKYAELPDE